MPSYVYPLSNMDMYPYTPNTRIRNISHVDFTSYMFFTVKFLFTCMVWMFISPCSFYLLQIYRSFLSTITLLCYRFHGYKDVTTTFTEERSRGKQKLKR